MSRFLGCIVLFVLLALALPARAAVERYAVVVGDNRGDVDEPELRFAEKDAERVHAVLKDVGGFMPDRMLLLRGEKAAAVERSLIAMNDRIRAAQSRPGTQVMLLVYFSGHADAQSLHLERSALELTLLEQLVRSSAAAFRILIVDACRSGSLTRVKGGTPAPAFAVKIDETLSGEGTVFLTSSSANEDAQESDALAGSFFTHYLVSGLLGPADTDRDGRVTLDEAYRYAHTNTLRASSRTLAGEQHPTFRYELRGQGRLVLSEPFTDRTSRGILEFPPGRSYLVFAGDENGTVEGEIGAHDAVRVLSVRPGTHFVRGRGSAFLLEGKLDVRPGDSVTVADDRLTRVEYARLARKGGADARLAQGPQAGYTFRTSLANDTGLCQGAFAGYALAFPALTLAPRFHYCRSGFENRQLSATIDELAVGVHLELARDIAPITLSIGGDLGAALHHQHFDTPGQAPDRSTLGGLLGASAGIGVEIAWGFSAFAESGVEGQAFAIERTATHEHDAVATLAFRQRLGLLKWW